MNSCGNFCWIRITSINYLNMQSKVLLHLNHILLFRTYSVISRKISLNIRMSFRFCYRGVALDCKQFFNNIIHDRCVKVQNREREQHVLALIFVQIIFLVKKELSNLQTFFILICNYFLHVTCKIKK